MSHLECKALVKKPGTHLILPDTLQLDFNYLSGTIPKEMGTMLSLSKDKRVRKCLHCTLLIVLTTFLNATGLLSIGQNIITGKVPTELGQLLSLGKTRLN
jgi:hypothetical protein